MRLELFWSDKATNLSHEPVKAFLQRQVNRLMVGQFRYGAPHKSKQYMTKLGAEFRAYKKTGNAEHLINIANYALLESEHPENTKHHFDNSARSVTRGD